MFTVKFYFTPIYKVEVFDTAFPISEGVMEFVDTNVTPEVMGIYASSKTPEEALNKIIQSYLNRVEALQKEENTLKGRIEYLNSVNLCKINIENE